MSNPKLTNPFWAAGRGQLGNIRAWLDAGGDPNVQAGFGKNTPLHLASQYGQLAVAELLIKSGASPNLTNRTGHTALHHAAMRDQRQLAELLMLHNANVNAFSPPFNATPADSALAGGHLEMVALLKRHGGIHNKTTEHNDALGNRLTACILPLLSMGGIILLIAGWMSKNPLLKQTGSCLVVIGVSAQVLARRSK
jgi:ankyrin repeat protein